MHAKGIIEISFPDFWEMNSSKIQQSLKVVI